MMFQPSSSLSKTSVGWWKNVSLGRTFLTPGQRWRLSWTQDSSLRRIRWTRMRSAFIGRPTSRASAWRLRMLRLSLPVRALRPFTLVIAQHQVPLVRRQLRQASAEAVEAAVGRLAVVERRRRPGSSFGEDALLARGAAHRFLEDQMGDAAEVAVGIARPQLDPLGKPAGYAVHRLVRQIFRHGAAAPFEETDELAADRLVAFAGALAIAVQLAEERFELLRRHPRAAQAHFHSPWREKPAQK